MSDGDYEVADDLHDLREDIKLRERRVMRRVATFYSVFAVIALYCAYQMVMS